MNTDLFKVWMAGFYEGEGYVSMTNLIIIELD